MYSHTVWLQIESSTKVRKHTEYNHKPSKTLVWLERLQLFPVSSKLDVSHD